MSRKLFYVGLTVAAMTAGIVQAEPLPLSDMQLDNVAAGRSFDRLLNFGVNVDIRSSADLDGETAFADADADLVGPGMIFVETFTETDEGSFSLAESDSMAQNNRTTVQSRATGLGFGNNSTAGSNTRASLGHVSRAMSSSFAASNGFRSGPF